MNKNKKSGYGSGKYGQVPKPEPLNPPDWLNVGPSKKKPKNK